MKPILVDVATVKRTVKGPFLPYISRKRLDRAVRKFRPGKLKPKQPYLEFVPAPWSADDLLILPGLAGVPGGVVPCRLRMAYVRDASGTSRLRFWFDCGQRGSGVCGYMELFPSLNGSLQCSMFQSTCRGVCRERRGTGPLGIGLRVWCECSRI